jgi:hypothetical protein
VFQSNVSLTNTGGYLSNAGNVVMTNATGFFSNNGYFSNVNNAVFTNNLSLTSASGNLSNAGNLVMTNASGFFNNAGYFSNSGPGYFSNILRSGIFVSSLTNTYAVFYASNYGTYYYITNSGFSNIGIPAPGDTTVGGVTVSPANITVPFAGWFITLRNNTSSYLSITVAGTNTSTPASPFTIPPANSVTLAYEGATNSFIYF